MQRDLTDSTVLRNMGVALGYTLLGYDSLQRGLDKLQVNQVALAADLDASWEVLAEAVQTVMRRHGLPNPYEQLKKMTRGKAITAAAMRKFVATPGAARRRQEAPAGADAGRLHRPGGRAGAAGVERHEVQRHAARGAGRP